MARTSAHRIRDLAESYAPTSCSPLALLDLPPSCWPAIASLPPP